MLDSSDWTDSEFSLIIIYFVDSSDFINEHYTLVYRANIMATKK